jgi:hypothetical protein
MAKSPSFPISKLIISKSSGSSSMSSTENIKWPNLYDCTDTGIR